MVKDMCTIMKHGGPDDEGIYTNAEHHLVLGHRRLSLIDLSSSGHQPMSYAEGRYEISFNGEIYNYIELKNQLKNLGHSFTTGSDTEVILAAFAAWGTESFSRLNGMFAFALWDNLNKALYLVRDPSGIKPLYYAATPEGLAFSSEIKGFRPISYLQEENDQWPVFLMAYGHLPEPVTILKRVKPLQKGSFLRYDACTQQHTTQRFKQFQFSSIITERKEAMHLVRENLQNSVRRHLIADAPIGVFLSGGLDSGIIALLANADKQTRLNTLSLFFEEDEFSEKRYQDLLLDKLGCTRNQHLLKEEEFHEHLPDIFQAMDQPSCDGINTWFISQHAKENGLKAVLSGIGGDELYGGYPSFSRIQKANLLGKIPRQLLKSGKYAGLKSLRRLGYLSLGGAQGKYLFLRGQFIPYEIANHLDMSEEQVWNILGGEPQCNDIEIFSAFDQASWIETNLFMQNQLLRDVDVMSMAHGIEIRVPFLDREFVDLSMTISDKVKAHGSFPKQLLIDTFKDILPEPVWNRPKMGFGMPFKKWLANDDLVKELVHPDDAEFQRFASGNMHWSQFLSLVLIKNRGISSGHKFITESGASTISQPATSFAIPQAPHLIAKKNNGPAKKILFLTLRTFSITGGIEKVSKLAGKAIYEWCTETGNQLRVRSMYDESRDIDEKYFPAQNFKGFGIRRLRFTRKCVAAGIKQDIVILSHVNLLTIGYLIKLLSPKTRLVLIAHGIEVWKPFAGIKKRMLLKCDQILSVSQYTKDTIEKLNPFPPEKIQVLNNCLDPFLVPPLNKEKDATLLEKYQLEKSDVVLMTLTRMASGEKYKGYDMVVESLHKLKASTLNLKYLLIGKYDDKEKARLDGLIKKYGMEEQVVFTGFVPDEALADHFNLSDIYIMPSEMEGFGIVFIEAMYHNKPVIAGNKDGSVDALLNGKLGLLVNPESLEEVSCAITTMISHKDQFLPDRELLMNHFSYPVYKEKWKKILESN
jgi:asparagine synthase (glutamine-hydrolysing)